MPRIMTLKTATDWALSLAGQLQKAHNFGGPEKDLDVDDWSDIADDFEALAAYARGKANKLAEEEEE